MDTQQYQLFHESIYKALETCVQALGGSKQVGFKLWGESTTPDNQGRKVDHCLNPSHAQKFSLDELLWILRKAHDIGCHAGITFICRETGYQDPQPIVIEDEEAKLKRDFIQSVKLQQAILNRLEHLGDRA